MKYTETITINYPADGGIVKLVDVEVEVDMTLIARAIGYKAVKSHGGTSTALYGAVRVSRSKGARK